MNYYPNMQISGSHAKCMFHRWLEVSKIGEVLSSEKTSARFIPFRIPLYPVRLRALSISKRGQFKIYGSLMTHFRMV